MFKRLKYLIPSFRRDQEREMLEEMEALAEIVGRKELGNLTLAAENARAAWGWTWLEGIAADLRYAFRMLRRQPAFFAVAMLSLGLGIGANAAIFSLIDTLLIRQLPVRQPERLVHFDIDSCSYFTYQQLLSKSGPAMDGIAAGASLDRNVDGNSSHLEFVSGNYFQVLGVNARLGRTLTPDDDRIGDPSAVAVVSYRFWQRALGGDPSVIGRQIRIERTRFTVAGVAPPEFFGIRVGDPPDIWAPLTSYSLVLPGPNPLENSHNNFLELVGRLRSGVSMERAAAMLTSVMIGIQFERAGADLTDEIRKLIEQEKVTLRPAGKGISYLRTRYSRPLQIIFAMVGIGLLLACLNVMSLQLARADERRRELSVRLAIGAGRGRMIRQLLTESFLLAGAGGALGLAMCRPSAQALASLISGERLDLDLRINAPVLLFVLGVSLLSAMLCGLIPAERATRGELSPALQQGARSATATRPRRTLARLVTSTQMALSVVLIAGAFLFSLSLYKLTHFDTGLNRQRLVVAEVSSVDAGYKGAALSDLNRRLLARLRAMHGVESASFTWTGIYSGRNFSTQVDAEGFHPPKKQYIYFDQVGPGFVSAAGARLLAGRDFTDRDDQSSAKVAIINQRFAKYFFPDGNAVGRNIYVKMSKVTTYQVIGVVQDLWEDVRHEPRRYFYLPHSQFLADVPATRFLVRTSSAAAAADIRAVIRAEDPALRIVGIDDADHLLYRGLVTDRLIAALSLAFGLLALVLAAVGIYGLLAYDVTRRTAEIGIRVALGATRRGVIALVFREVALVAILGIGAGTMATILLGRLVEKLVFQLTPGDPRVMSAAVLVLAAVAVTAAWFPARRAASMDPMRALRTE